jgi:muramoyltetrapeptide carboxypeptidase
MLQNLKRNGMLENIKGLIVGGMNQMNDNTIPFGKTPQEIILDICDEYNFPIASDFPAGHGKDNKTMILGRKVILEVNKNKIKLLF